MGETDPEWQRQKGKVRVGERKEEKEKNHIINMMPNLMPGPKALSLQLM